MAAKTNADESANDGGDESTTEQTEAVEVELAPADAERIEYELANGANGEHSPETVAEFIEQAVWMEFARIDNDAVYHAAVEVEVPDATLKRAVLAAKSRRERHGESRMGLRADVEDRLLNDVAVDYHWQTTDGVGIDLNALDELD